MVNKPYCKLIIVACLALAWRETSRYSLWCECQPLMGCFRAHPGTVIGGYFGAMRGHGDKFNVFEILEIAERAEQRGARFYIQTAKRFREAALQDVFYKLANGKVKQQKAWAKMRKEVSKQTGEFGTYDPDNYVLSNHEVMAGLSWFGTRAGRAKKP